MMTMIEFWGWMDALGQLAWSSSESMTDRLGYALWWVDLGEAANDCHWCEGHI